MKRMPSSIALVLVAMVCVVMVATPLAAAEDGLKKVDTAWLKAALANDPAALAAVYADDAVLVLPGSPEIKGRKAIADAYAGWLQHVKITAVAIDDAHYHSAGNVSAGWGKWSMTTEPRAGGASTTITGTWCAVALKENGSWHYVADHASQDPAPAPAQ